MAAMLKSITGSNDVMLKEFLGLADFLSTVFMGSSGKRSTVHHLVEASAGERPTRQSWATIR